MKNKEFPDKIKEFSSNRSIKKKFLIKTEFPNKKKNFHIKKRKEKENNFLLSASITCIEK